MPVKVKPTKPRKGLLPTHAIGQPFAAKPSLVIPETLTAVGDQTGKKYFKFGDNTNGPETVKVTPPAGSQPIRASVGASRTPSMAGGGMALVGNQPEDPQAVALRQRRALLNSRNNVNDIRAMGTAQTLQNQGDQAYGQLGVSAPQSIDMPAGNQTSNSFVRPTIRSQTSYLQDQFDQENLAADEQAYQNSRSMVTGASSSGVARSSRGPSFGNTSVTGARSSTGGGGGGTDSTNDPRVRQEYIDPITGDRQMLLPVEIAMRESQNKKTLSQMSMTPQERQQDQQDQQRQQAESQGLVEYRDPNNPGTPEYLTPNQAAIRKSDDAQRLKTTLEQRATAGQAKQILGNLSVSQLTDMAVRGTVSARDYEQALKTRLDKDGQPQFTPDEVDSLLYDMLSQARASKSNQRSLLQSQYGNDNGDQIDYSDPNTLVSSIVQSALHPFKPVHPRTP